MSCSKNNEETAESEVEVEVAGIRSSLVDVMKLKENVGVVMQLPLKILENLLTEI